MILLLALTACVRPPAAGTADRRALDSVVPAWRSAGLPGPTDCLQRTDIERHSNYDEFKAACKNPFATTGDPRTLTGCTTSGFSKIPWQDNVYTIHIAPNNPHEFTTLQHEGCHVMVFCSNLHSNGDALHTDSRIWIRAGGVTSVEARAQEQVKP